MNIVIEFDFDHSVKSDNKLWSLKGKCIPTQIHPDEKELERRLNKLLPEKIKSDFSIDKIIIDDKLFDPSKSIIENKIFNGTIVILFMKLKDKTV
jgi:hypothetical protein